ncbi:MAG: hypothetical protein KF716_31340 [Anaerolineae bacterium]|nr:hypothetical protein [Anaerolineae bacterium]
MPINRRLLTFLVIIGLVGLSTPTLTTTRAQTANVVVTVAMRANISNQITPQMIADFETANPGVTFKTIETTTNLPDPTADLEAYYTALNDYVSAADVVIVDSNHIGAEATVAGYYLDLSPLVQEDSSLNASDFYPSAWQSFQWDKGIWALPLSADPYILTYDPTAFDDAGIAYPDPQWSLDDLANAARTLTQKDDAGNVTRAGLGLFSNQGDTLLMRSLLSTSLFDSSVVPNPPQLDTPEVENLLTTMRALQDEGVIGRQFNQGPMALAPVFSIAGGPNNQNTRKGVLLPGNKGMLDVRGLALSAGTTHPQEAYAVAKFLTTRPEIAAQGTTSPARISLVGEETNSGGGPGPGGRNLRSFLSPELQALSDEAVNNGVPFADLRYMNYLNTALQAMKDSGIDAKAALQEVETQAQTDLQTAADKKSSVAITVAAPPGVDLPEGKMQITFGIAGQGGRGGGGTQQAWKDAATDFAANDPQVGYVDIKTGNVQFEDAVTRYDCFYLPYNAVANADLSQILPLTPLMETDANFDKGDFVGDVLNQVSRDGQTWAYPIQVEPSILRYDADAFNKAGAVNPTAGWTIDQFNDALKTLKIYPEDPAPFQDRNSGGVHLLIMIAAYGGLPLDYRTSPATVNFTDPKNEAAIQQVLDLAKNGYLSYTRLSNISGGRVFGGPDNALADIETESLNVFGFRPPNNNNQGATTTSRLPTTYPIGTEFSGASYNVGVGFISATTQAAEGCYRFLDAASRNPRLIQAMPAHRSLIPEVAATQGQDVEPVYNAIDKVIADPNTIVFPALQRGGFSPTGFLLQYWLFQAFDGYVLDGKDLTEGLTQAQGIATDFQACTANLPAPNISDQAATRDYNRAVVKCAVSVDSSLSALAQFAQ